MKMKQLLIILIVIYFAVLQTGSWAGAEAVPGNLSVVKLNDSISIKVLGNNHLNTDAIVSLDGTISFPYLGNIYVEGKSLSEVEAEITKKLSEGFIKYPVVSVSFQKGVNRKIYTYGEIARMGTIVFEEDLTLIIAISLAGGLTENGLYGDVKVRRKREDGQGYKDIMVDLDGKTEGVATGDMILQPDDVIIVEKSSTFYVNGEVLNPGKYMLQKKLTVMKALSEAGSIIESGLYGDVKVRRKREDGQGFRDIMIDLEGKTEEMAKGDMILQPDDILIVEKSKTFYVNGEVVNPGEQVLQKDMSVERALVVAGGLTENGLYGDVKVRREKKDGQGYEDIEIDFSGNKEGMVKGDMILQPDDILFVEPNNTYYIYGEVNSTGEFVIKKGLTAFKALTISGGFTKWGSPDRFKILRRDKTKENNIITIKVEIGDVLKGIASADVLLEPGDIIVVSSGMF